MQSTGVNLKFAKARDGRNPHRVRNTSSLSDGRTICVKRMNRERALLLPRKKGVLEQVMSSIKKASKLRKHQTRGRSPHLLTRMRRIASNAGPPGNDEGNMRIWIKSEHIAGTRTHAGLIDSQTRSAVGTEDSRSRIDRRIPPRPSIRPTCGLLHTPRLLPQHAPHSRSQPTAPLSVINRRPLLALSRPTATSAWASGEKDAAAAYRASRRNLDGPGGPRATG